jgi:Xrn1 SH3-like domain
VAMSEISVDQGLPALAAAPIGEAKSSGLPAFGRSVPGSAQRPEVAADPAEPEVVERPRALRIGDRVRSFVDDVCVSVGLTGLVVNVAPPRYGAPARARILWDNETVSMADAHTFEVLGLTDTTTGDGEQVA